MIAHLLERKITGPRLISLNMYSIYIWSSVEEHTEVEVCVTAAAAGTMIIFSWVILVSLVASSTALKCIGMFLFRISMTVLRQICLSSCLKIGYCCRKEMSFVLCETNGVVARNLTL